MIANNQTQAGSEGQEDIIRAYSLFENATKWVSAEAPTVSFPRRGVYFLLQGEYVVYVGMSLRGVGGRIFGFGNPYHWECHADTKTFTHFKYINLDRELRDYAVRDMESLFINLFSPPLNTTNSIGAYLHLLPQSYTDTCKKDEQRYLRNMEEQTSLLARRINMNFKY